MLDPLAVVLLLWRPRLGVWLTLGIMVVDVVVNVHHVLLRADNLPLGVVAQVGFLGVVLGSAPFLLQTKK